MVHTNPNTVFAWIEDDLNFLSAFRQQRYFLSVQQVVPLFLEEFKVKVLSPQGRKPPSGKQLYQLLHRTDGVLIGHSLDLSTRVIHNRETDQQEIIDTVLTNIVDSYVYDQSNHSQRLTSSSLLSHLFDELYRLTGATLSLQAADIWLLRYKESHPVVLMDPDVRNTRTLYPWHQSQCEDILNEISNCRLRYTSHVLHYLYTMISEKYEIPDSSLYNLE